ncbi:MAG: DUF983 domain-containing protein [Rhodospirillales bacterium]|jgi:uncharacterized protein (DUF983 family)|nr:DUF983 domain-containing protein [Rhodospirillales bacterium]MBT4038469.1 DUF983 domain-containing protein [Rhodospirillales bacterium]MBT4625676.1 DUF983 domain-containing protein [Rhodospirillales bacterium]MBT5351858.1 DUF983 domain-containing protein [Rhodospirillales bacterium]MBT5522342.1 DUF983 domain-containing protein [Rhodospirillales bacterium]
MNMITESKAPLLRTLTRGFRRRCPRCGAGRLYRAYLKPVDSCQSCSEQLGHIRADDIPAYFTIAVVGHIVVPSAVIVEQNYHPPEWLHLSMWIPLVLILTLSLLPSIKGTLVSLLWHLSLTGDEKQ